MPKWAETMLFVDVIKHGVPSYSIRQKDGQSASGFTDTPYSAEAWRETVSGLASFAFHGKLGSFTARAEERKEHLYWYAYHRVEGKLQKRYIGMSNHLTLDQLEHIADQFRAKTKGLTR